MSTQAASLKRKNAPATKAAIDKPPTPAPARKKAVTRPSAPEQAKPAVPRAPVRAAKATTTPAKAAEKATRTAPRPSPAREATLPSLRFHHSHALRERTLIVIDAIETGPAARGHGEALADLVAELVQAGMDW